MGYTDMAVSLDSSMLQFVEPLGPGQIVDRQSPVSVPEGRLQVAFEDRNRKLLVRILAFQNKLRLQKNDSIKTAIKSYFAMGNHVLEGREHEENSSEPGLLHVFDKTVMERLAFGLSGASSPVHKILQICVFRGRAEDLVGFVHISMSGIMKASTDVTMNVSTYAGCYPVFPRSSFIAGCPVGCVTPHCVKPWTETTDGSGFRSREIVCSDHLTLDSIADDNAEMVKKGVVSERSSNRVIDSDGCEKPRTARNFRKYGKVVTACQTLKRLGQSRKPPNRPAAPVTVSLHSEPKLPGSTSSSSSVEMDFGSSANSTASESEPMSVTPPNDFNVGRPSNGHLTLRSLSLIAAKVRPNLKRARRSFTVGESWRWGSSAQPPVPKFRRSEEIIPTNFRTNFYQTSNGEQLKSDSFLVSSNGAVSSSAIDALKKSENNAGQHGSVLSRATVPHVARRPLCPPQRSLSVPAEKSDSLSVGYPSAVDNKNSLKPCAKTVTVSKASHPETHHLATDTLRKMPDVISKKSKTNGNKGNGKSFNKWLNLSGKVTSRHKAPMVKSSLSFPPVENMQPDSEPDNVYEVLSRLKKMSMQKVGEKSGKNQAPTDKLSQDENFSDFKAISAPHTSVSEISSCDTAVANRCCSTKKTQACDFTRTEGSCNVTSILKGTAPKQTRVPRSPQRDLDNCKLTEKPNSRNFPVAKTAAKNTQLIRSENSDEEYISCTEQVRSTSSSTTSSYSNL